MALQNLWAILDSIIRNQIYLSAAQIEDAFTSAAWVVVVADGPVSRSSGSGPTTVRWVAMIRVAGPWARVARVVVARPVWAALGTATEHNQCCQVAGPPVSNLRRLQCRQFQVRDRLSLLVASFSFLWPVGPPLFRLVTARSAAAPRPWLPWLVRLPGAPCLVRAWTMLVAPVVSTLGGSLALISPSS